MTFSFLDLLLIIISSQGLFLLIAIQLMPNKNREANQALTFVLAIASFMLVARVLLYHIENPLVLRLGGAIDGAIYLFGPFLYLYIRRLTFREQKIYRLNWKHFILVMIYSIYFMWSLSLDMSAFMEFRRSWSAGIAYGLVELAGIVSISFYLIKSFKLYRIFKENQVAEVSFDQQVLKYLQSLLWALSIFIVLWMVGFVGAYILRYYVFAVGYSIMWISSAFMMYIIGFYSLTQPHIFRIQMPKKEEVKTSKNRLKQAEITKIQTSIESILEKDRVYLESDLSLSGLAEKLETTTNNLSWVLNNVYKKTFYELINEYRIHDFIHRIQENQHKQLTLFSIALEVGFNSKSTFNKAFKSITHQTPTNYIRQIESSTNR